MVILLGLSSTSCDDYLDREPQSQVAPERYFSEAAQLQAYADKYYADILPSHDAYYEST